MELTKRVRKAPQRWIKDPLTTANLGGSDVKRRRILGLDKEDNGPRNVFNQLECVECLGEHRKHTCGVFERGCRSDLLPPMQPEQLEQSEQSEQPEQLEQLEQPEQPMQSEQPMQPEQPEQPEPDDIDNILKIEIPSEKEFIGKDAELLYFEELA